MKFTIYSHEVLTMTKSTTMKSVDEVYTYYKQALDLLDPDHPHYDEIRKLLVEQIKDELHTNANSRPN